MGLNSDDQEIFCVEKNVFDAAVVRWNANHLISS